MYELAKIAEAGRGLLPSLRPRAITTELTGRISAAPASSKIPASYSRGLMICTSASPNAATGELLRELALDPTRTHQPTTWTPARNTAIKAHMAGNSVTD